MAEENKKLTIDDVVPDLGMRIEDAHQFVTGEFTNKWATSELYYAGGSDLPTEAGRSTVIKTVVRDAIRAVMPSILRTLLQSKKPVEYIPASQRNGAYVEQQAEWIWQTFNNCGGYTALYNVCLESLKNGAGPIKTYWEEKPSAEFFKVTAVPYSEVIAYLENEDVEVVSVEKSESPVGGVLELFDVEFNRFYLNGRIRLEAFPIYEFFVERAATNLNEYLHGHRRAVTVTEAQELGLDADWDDFDYEEPEYADAAEAATHRRGYNPDDGEQQSIDQAMRKFLLTEAYASYDLDGDGVAEQYIFYLGGTTHKYIHHERIGDFAIDVVRHDPIPFSIIGTSIIDILKSNQDTTTSILRATVDNAHIANNPRPVADPSNVDFADLMNNAIGAPIKRRGEANIQLFDVPFTAGNLMPLLEWMDRDSEVKAGITKAASGLDPDSLQSTDKTAVMNTIQLSQGQVELMVRNIVETGLIPIFQKMLRLSMNHMDRQQLLRLKGELIPVDTSKFDADLLARANVGLGTANIQQKQGTLMFIYGEQTKMMAQFGLDNPFTSLSQMYNTLEDLAELGGITNVSRYFKFVDQVVEQAIAKKQEEAAAEAAKQAEANQPTDPTRALLMVESMKSRDKQMELMATESRAAKELELRAIMASDDYDLRRDELVQKRRIELLKLSREDQNASIAAEQERNNKDAKQKPNSTGSAAPSGE